MGIANNNCYIPIYKSKNDLSINKFRVNQNNNSNSKQICPSDKYLAKNYSEAKISLKNLYWKHNKLDLKQKLNNCEISLKNLKKSTN